MAIWLAVKRIFRKLPLLGGLVDARVKDHTEAISEVGLNILLSTVPISLGAILMKLHRDTESTWVQLMLDNVQSGELFLYATALLGPLYYFIFKEYTNVPNFPKGRSFMVAAVCILVISVGLFSAQRVEILFNRGSILDRAVIFSMSWKIYLTSVAVVYLAHVYKNLLESGAPTISTRDTQEFVDDYVSRRRNDDG